MVMQPEVGTAAFIRDQLQQVIERRFGGVRLRMEGKCKLGHGTVNKWFDRENPSMPTVPQLAKVAACTGVSLDWLIYGRGQMEWPTGPAQLLDEVRCELERKLGPEQAAQMAEGLDQPCPQWGLMSAGDQVVSDNRAWPNAVWKRAVKDVVWYLEECFGP